MSSPQSSSQAHLRQQYALQMQQQQRMQNAVVARGQSVPQDQGQGQGQGRQIAQGGSVQHGQPQAQPAPTGNGSGLPQMDHPGMVASGRGNFPAPVSAVAGPSTPISDVNRARPVLGQGQNATSTPIGRGGPSSQPLNQSMQNPIQHQTQHQNQNNTPRPTMYSARPRPTPSALPLNSAQSLPQFRHSTTLTSATLGNTPVRTTHPLAAPPLHPNPLPHGNLHSGPNTASNPNSAASSPTSGTFPQSPSSSPFALGARSQQQQMRSSPGSTQPFRESNSSDPMRIFLAPHVARKKAEEKSRLDEIAQAARRMEIARVIGGTGLTGFGGPTSAVHPGSGSGMTPGSGSGFGPGSGSSTGAVRPAGGAGGKYLGIYNGGAGLAGPGGRDGMKRERGNFVGTAKELMHAFGDVRFPSEDAANLVVDMVFGYLTELCTMPPLPAGIAPDAVQEASLAKKSSQAAQGLTDADPLPRGRPRDRDRDQDKDKDREKERDDAEGNLRLRNLTIRHLRHRLSSSPAHSLQLSRFQEAFYANKLHKGFDAQRKQAAASFGNVGASTAEVSIQDSAMLEELALHAVDGDRNRLDELYEPKRQRGNEGGDEGDRGRSKGAAVKISLRERKRREMGQHEESRKRRRALARQVAKLAPPPLVTHDTAKDGFGGDREDAFGAFAMQLDMEDGEGLGGFLGDELKGANFGSMGDVLRRFM